MAISLVRVDISPNLHVMSLHRQHASHPLFVLREFDVKVLRHTAHRKKQDDDGNQQDEKHSSSPPRRHRVVCGESQFMATGPSEQALRVSIRAAVLRLGLTMEAATAHEIKLLKEADVLGKRAPSASLLTGPDMCHLLRAFGVHSIATKLARQLETLQPGVMIPCHEDTDVGSRRIKHDVTGDEEVVKKLRAKKDKDIRIKQENQSPNQVKRKLNSSQIPIKHTSSPTSSSSSTSSSTSTSTSSQPSPAKRPRSLSHGSQVRTETGDESKDEQAAGRHVVQCSPSSEPFDTSSHSTSGSIIPIAGQHSHCSHTSSYTPPTFPQFASPYIAPSHPHSTSHTFSPTHGYQTTHAPMGTATTTTTTATTTTTTTPPSTHANYEHQHEHHHHELPSSSHDTTTIYTGSIHPTYATSYPQQSHTQQSSHHQSQSHQQHAQHTQQHTTTFTNQQQSHSRQTTHNQSNHATQQQHPHTNNNNNTHHTTINRPSHIQQLKQQMGFPSRSPSTTHPTPASNIPPPSHPHNPPPPLTTRIQPITIPSHIPSHVLDSFPISSSPTLISPNPALRPLHPSLSSLMSPLPHIHPSISTQHLASLRAFSAHPFHKRDTNMCIDMNVDLGELHFPPLCDTQELKIRADISSLLPIHTDDTYFSSPHTDETCASEQSTPDGDTDADHGMESLDTINLEHEFDNQSYHQIIESSTSKSTSTSTTQDESMWKNKISRQISGNCQYEWNGNNIKHQQHQPMSIVT